MNPDIHAELNVLTEKVLALELKLGELEEDSLGYGPEIKRLEKEMAWLRRQHEAT